MVKKSARKSSGKAVRLICELVVGVGVLMIPVAMPTRLVLSFLFALLVGILLVSIKIARLAPWQLSQFQHPNPRAAFAESLLYTAGCFGLLVYLASSEHAPFHFALGFLGIICAWLMVQLIYSQQYALRYYQDGKGLVFPDCPQPHWTEFLYEGFCMAACFQTSDTSVNSRAMRQLIATHGILSYILSVSTIAMMFGLIGNLL